MNTRNSKFDSSNKIGEVIEHINRSRKRTNLLRKSEQRTIAYLVQHIPSWVSSDLLTAVGLFGNIIVSASFILAAYVNKYFLLLGFLGFTINWFGDSLDGRLAYYRNKPRKLFGFTLDITIDWIGIILIGYGYIVYTDGIAELLGYSFVVMYGWEMIIALMKYKITKTYSIDSGIIGPTEVRIIISAIMLTELFLPGSIKYFTLIVGIILFIFNIKDTRKLLKIAENKDEKAKKKREINTSKDSLHRGSTSSAAS